METKRADKLAMALGLVTGLVLGGVSVYCISQVQPEREKTGQDICQMVDGEKTCYRVMDGQIQYTVKEEKMPKLRPAIKAEGTVCMAMKGVYTLDVGEKVKCYSSEGVEIILPSLEGKEVIIVDGTVVLKDKG